MTTTRRATHAGSWYSASSSKLNSELEGWLGQVQLPAASPLDDSDTIDQLPIRGCRAIIAPHAGYSYSGPAAAWAYRCIDTTNIKRVFVLGPSHHAYLDGCALTRCDDYATPVGNLPIDTEMVKQLAQTGKFSEMSQSVDEDEHSIEMHLPYIRKTFEGRDIKLVPILVGAISTSKEKVFGKLLAPYLADPANFFVVSSDFCHWGSRFRYTYYKAPDSPAVSLSRRDGPSPTCAIHSSITALDHEGMAHISFSPAKGALQAHADFAAYLSRTKNTICGRHPIGVLLAAAAELQETGTEGWSKETAELKWTRYEQSSQCEDVSDSSVSYASAYLKAGQ